MADDAVAVVRFVFDSDTERWWPDSIADQDEGGDDPLHYRTVPAELAVRYFAAAEEFAALHNDLVDAAGVHLDSETLIDPCGQCTPCAAVDIPEAWIVERDGRVVHTADSEPAAEAWIAALPDTMMEGGRVGAWIVVHRSDFTVAHRPAHRIGGAYCERCGNPVDEHDPTPAGVDG